ncbi:ABC transporter substrate-binding protein [Clostridium sp. SYSU_GA19001]|uniref:ABC transporter substrate-binding protein n=1 Tax=Clostridium caldaquaticum TaxID=2940653 RepID=UPI002076F743|nr:ABC transporter substrate-binding protein [Clostridium caldaquaticum]MCM8712038.1 ABC transporter substrate-binding protein [Clostridium caldaquaticum]
MNFRKIISIILTVIIVFITGCQNANTADNKPKDEIAGKITLWTNRDSINILKLSAENFKKLHTDVDIDIIEVGKTELKEKLSLSLSLKSDLPDIVIAEDEEIQFIINRFKDSLEDVGDYIKKGDYLEYKINNLSFENKLYGIPLNSKTAVMIYRVDVLNSLGINAEYIKTYEDFITAGQNVLKSSGKKMIALPADIENTYRMLLNQLGQSYFEKDGKPVLNSPKTQRTLGILKKIYESGIVQEVKSTKDYINLIKNGTVAAAVLTPEGVNSFIKEIPELKGKLQVMKIPAFEEGGNQAVSLGGDNVLLLNSSQNKKAAIEFSKFTTEDKDNITELIKELGMIPSYIKYYDEKWFGKEEEYFQGQKLWRLYSELAEDIYAVIYTKHFSKVKQSVQEAVAKIVLQGQDAVTIIDELQKSAETSINLSVNRVGAE